MQLEDTQHKRVSSKNVQKSVQTHNLFLFWKQTKSCIYRNRFSICIWSGQSKEAMFLMFISHSMLLQIVVHLVKDDVLHGLQCLFTVKCLMAVVL